jgi:hypothetical protein
MFKVKVARVAALVLLATGAAVLISCQGGPSEPTPGALPETDAHYVYGYCYSKIYCVTCDDWIYTEDTSGPNGYYRCDPAPPEYSTHHGDDVYAVAFDGFTEWGRSSTETMVADGLRLDIHQNP